MKLLYQWVYYHVLCICSHVLNHRTWKQCDCMKCGSYVRGIKVYQLGCGRTATHRYNERMTYLTDFDYSWFRCSKSPENHESTWNINPALIPRLSCFHWYSVDIWGICFKLEYGCSASILAFFIINGIPHNAGSLLLKQAHSTDTSICLLHIVQFELLSKKSRPLWLTKLVKGKIPEWHAFHNHCIFCCCFALFL